jgi:hypothetical protein
MTKLKASHFNDFINQTYMIESYNDTVYMLTLKEVNSSPSNISPKIESFSLIFESSDSMVLPQRAYLLRFPSGTTHEIFLVPVGRTEAHVTYEAIFNYY